MTGFPGSERPQVREAVAPERAPASPDLTLFAQLEGLSGEEEALLKIPARQRTEQQANRLREITAELDRMWEKLRERAERLGRHAEPGQQHSG